MRHITKDFLLKSPLDREHEMFEKIKLADSQKDIDRIRFTIWLDDLPNKTSLLNQLKRRENFLKD
jgi:hypothetical protein